MVGALAVAGTFLLAAAFYAATLHVAASYVLGDAAAWRALLVGPAPATAVVAGQLLTAPRLATAVAALSMDLLAIAAVYRVRARTAVLVTFAHLVVAIVLGFALWNLLGLP